jgi:hypothetical protein
VTSEFKKEAVTTSTENLELRGFKSEEDLVSSFGAFLAATCDGTYEVISEHEAGFGRPDVLLFNRVNHSSNDVHKLARIPLRLAPLLARSAAQSIATIEDVAKLCGVSFKSATRVIKELERAGCLPNRKATASARPIKIEPVSAPPFKSVVAIEAKLRDWKRALVQAYRYLEFAHESWVLLDHNFIGNALREKEMFRSSGVGLASFSIRGDLYIHIPSRKRKQPENALAWRTQAILSRHLLEPKVQNSSKAARQ